MAIDSTNEKFALITLLQPWNTPIPISADGLGQDDKQHLIWGYPGILWATIGLVRRAGQLLLLGVSQ